MLRKLIISSLLLLAIHTSQAQFFKSLLPSPEFNEALETIVRDFKYNYQNIEGDLLESQGEVDTYETTVKLPGAGNCIIYKFHSGKDTTASWQGVLYSGDDYNEAVKVYRNTFRMIHKSKIHLVDRTIISFAGNLQEPTETIRFAISSLRLAISDNRYKRFNAEVELVTNYNGWQVNVNFHNK